MRNFSLLLIVFGMTVYITMHLMCSKNPAEPELPDESDPCLECPPIEVEVPCKSINLIVRFFLGGNNSFPDLYIFEREGFADEEIRIVSINTSFVRILDNPHRAPCGQIGCPNILTAEYRTNDQNIPNEVVAFLVMHLKNSTSANQRSLFVPPLK